MEIWCRSNCGEMICGEIFARIARRTSSSWTVLTRLFCIPRRLLAGLRAPYSIGIGGRVARLPCHTTVHAGPHTAVRRIKLGPHDHGWKPELGKAMARAGEFAVRHGP